MPTTLYPFLFDARSRTGQTILEGRMTDESMAQHIMDNDESIAFVYVTEKATGNVSRVFRSK